MAEPTQYEKDLVAQYGQGMQDYINSQRGLDGKNNVMLGVNVDQQDVARVLSGFQANAGNVYTTDNINQTNTNPTVAPDDLLGIRNQISNELGLPGLQTEYNTSLADLAAAKKLAQDQQTAIENLPQALNVIRGEQATAGALASNRISALAEAANVKQQQVQAANMELAARYGIRESEVNQKKEMMVQYPGAGIKFGDSFESVSSKLNTYQKQQEKDARKQSLKDKLLSLGLKTSGSIKQLEKRLRKANKQEFSNAKEEARLKLEGLRLDIENTKSLIANRGRENQQGLYTDLVMMKDEYGGDVPYWVNPKTGTFKPAQEPKPSEPIQASQPGFLSRIGSAISNWWNN